MTTIALYSCIKITMINLTAIPWNDFDMQTLEGAKNRCPQLYKDAPCVRKFIKVKEKQHQVICGKDIKI